MTTTHHDNIAVGAAANASTFNGPMGQLDAAINVVAAEIDALDATLDDLIIASGTSDAETIAARGGYPVLDGRLDDLYLVNDVLLVDAAFAVTNTVARRFKTIGLAMAQCTGGETILVAPGRYIENVVMRANVILQGSGQATWNGSGLVGGTIVQGQITCLAVVGCIIRDLGIDASGLAGGQNGINSTAGAIDTYRTFLNLTIWGTAAAGVSHGIYGDGGRNTYRNLHIIDWYHGIAIHGSYATIDNVRFTRCVNTSLILKSKGGLNVEYCNVSNLLIEGDNSSGTALYSGPLHIQSSDANNTRYINISNVVVRFAILGGLYINSLDATGLVTDIAISNMVSISAWNASSTADFSIRWGQRIVLTNCDSVAKNTGNAYQRDDAITPAIDVSLYGCRTDASFNTRYVGDFTYGELNGHIIGTGQHLDRPSGSFRASMLSGANNSVTVTIGTTANSPVANLSNAILGTNDYGGIVFVWVRTNETTGGSSASYVLLVHKSNATPHSCVEIAKGGLTSGAGASTPSYTFTLDATNNKLLATPVGTSNINPVMSFAALGSIRVRALN